jgi:hypothetical protein
LAPMTVRSHPFRSGSIRLFKVPVGMCVGWMERVFFGQFPFKATPFAVLCENIRRRVRRSRCVRFGGGNGFSTPFAHRISWRASRSPRRWGGFVKGSRVQVDECLVDKVEVMGSGHEGDTKLACVDTGVRVVPLTTTLDALRYWRAPQARSVMVRRSDDRPWRTYLAHTAESLVRMW